MKKTFNTPAWEIVEWKAEDVLTTSGEYTGNTYQDNELPLVPFGANNGL